MSRVLVTEKIHQAGLDILTKEAEVIRGAGVSAATIIEEAARCQGILIRSAQINREIIQNLPELKVIAKHGIGVDNIDVQAATEKGVMVVNAPEANINAVAEHTLALIFSLTKNILPLDKAVRRGDFGKRTQVVNRELADSTVGLLGLGRIGRTLAVKLKALGMNVIAFDPGIEVKIAAEMGIELMGMDDVLAKADIVSVHVPLTSQTKGLLRENKLQTMKKGAYLINVSRGGIVDEMALYKTLVSGHLAGAGLDVFESEPPNVDNPLFSLPNVVLSPHNAALTDKALYAMATDAAQGVVDCLVGKIPHYIVNPDVLKNSKWLQPN